MNIDEIKNHDWWNLVPYKKGYGLGKTQRVLYDPEIVMGTVALGFNK